MCDDDVGCDGWMYYHVDPCSAIVHNKSGTDAFSMVVMPLFEVQNQFGDLTYNEFESLIESDAELVKSIGA